jgi:pimeloyl-ACP methyl ester carboxylesterase
MQYDKHTLYISGFGSSRKAYILPALEKVFGKRVDYYLLKNIFTEDLEHLKAIVEQVQGDIRIIGHSTGGFLALSLYSAFPEKIREIHAINPAFDLLYSLDRHVDAKDFLKERPLVEQHFKEHAVLTEADGFTLKTYQGKLDDRVHMQYNLDFTLANNGAFVWLEIGHRFTEMEFSQILELIAPEKPDTTR